VQVPPPPPSQSFAKIAAKSPPPSEEEPVEPVNIVSEAPKTTAAEESKPKESKPSFPPLENAKDTVTPVSDLSDMPSTKDMLNEKSGMFENFQLSSFVGA
jgi:heme-binding NEAT domain protein